MDISSINPHIRYAKKQMRYPNQRTTTLLQKSFSRNYDCRLFYFMTASGWLEVDGEKYNITNNSAVYLPPASRYRFFFNAESEYRAIVINFDFGQELSYLSESLKTVNEEEFSADRVSTCPIPEAFSRVTVREGVSGEPLLRCAEEFLTKRYLYRESASAELKGFLVELLRERNEGNSELVVAVIDYVKEHYSEQGLDNSAVAAHFGYHPYYISKLISTATGKPLGKYITYYRVRMAKELLSFSNQSIEMIATKCGFCSSAYFIKIFRESTGITPRRYRETKKKNNL